MRGRHFFYKEKWKRKGKWWAKQEIERVERVCVIFIAAGETR